MISAFAKAEEVFGDGRWCSVAVEAVTFIERNLQRGDRLLSTYRDGVAKLNGYLDDYAFFVQALLDVFEMTQDRRYLDHAVVLADAMIAHFWDPQSAGFFFTSDDHETLIVRSKPAFDGSIPSGNSVAARDLLRLYHYSERPVYIERAEALLRLVRGADARAAVRLRQPALRGRLFRAQAARDRARGAAQSPGDRGALAAHPRALHPEPHADRHRPHPRRAAAAAACRARRRSTASPRSMSATT